MLQEEDFFSERVLASLDGLWSDTGGIDSDSWGGLFGKVVNSGAVSGSLDFVSSWGGSFGEVVNFGAVS